MHKMTTMIIHANFPWFKFFIPQWIMKRVFTFYDGSTCEITKNTHFAQNYPAAFCFSVSHVEYIQPMMNVFINKVDYTFESLRKYQ